MFAKNYGVEIEQDYYDVNGFNRYPADIMMEYNQCIEEGLDIEQHKEFFEKVSALDNGEEKTKLSDEIFNIVINADIRADYKYNEPSKLNKIKKLRKEHEINVVMPDAEMLRKKKFAERGLAGQWVVFSANRLRESEVMSLSHFLKKPTIILCIGTYSLLMSLKILIRSINSGFEISRMPILLTACLLMMTLTMLFWLKK